jgi:hypothetical protein
MSLQIHVTLRTLRHSLLYFQARTISIYKRVCDQNI